MEKGITFFRCRIDDDSIGLSFCPIEDEDPEHDADVEDRMLISTTCERCRCETEHGLTMSAGEAVCDDCIKSEISE